jgi:hypothetical protein
MPKSQCLAFLFFSRILSNIISVPSQRELVQGWIYEEIEQLCDRGGHDNAWTLPEALTHLYLVLGTPQKFLNDGDQWIARVPFREDRLFQIWMHDVLYSPRVVPVVSVWWKLPTDDAPVRPLPSARACDDSRRRFAQRLKVFWSNEMRNDHVAMFEEVILER